MCVNRAKLECIPGEHLCLVVSLAVSGGLCMVKRIPSRRNMSVSSFFFLFLFFNSNIYSLCVVVVPLLWPFSGQVVKINPSHPPPCSTMTTPTIVCLFVCLFTLLAGSVPWQVHRQQLQHDYSYHCLFVCLFVYIAGRLCTMASS